MARKSPTHLSHYVTIHHTHIVHLHVHFSAYFLVFVAMFISLFKFFYTHISHIVCLYFHSHRSHCNVVFSHTSQYDFTHISRHILCVCIHVSHVYGYVVFSLYISLYSHASHMFLYSHPTHFVKTFFAILVLHTFTFHTPLVLTFLFSKAKLHTHLFSIFWKY